MSWIKYTRDFKTMATVVGGVALIMIIFILKRISDFKIQKIKQKETFVSEFKNYTSVLPYDRYNINGNSKYAGLGVYNEQGKCIGIVGKDGKIRDKYGRVIGIIDRKGRGWKGNIYLGSVEKPQQIKPVEHIPESSPPAPIQISEEDHNKPSTSTTINKTNPIQPLPEHILLPSNNNNTQLPTQIVQNHKENTLQQNIQNQPLPQSGQTANLQTQTQNKDNETPFPVDVVYSGDPSKEASELEPDADYILPRGRLIRCKLVNTVDSSRLQTPAIAIMLQNVEFNHKVFFRAGTEVHGFMQNANMRDRVASSPQWVIVIQDPNNPEINGKELKIKAIALDMAKDPDTNKWGITDGSAGIKGYLINENKYAEAKALLAAALSGAAEGLPTTEVLTYQNGNTQTTSGGEWQDIAGGAIEKSMDLLTNRLLASLTRDSIYVRIPAGKCFYLYNLEPIDIRKAKRGGSKS